MSAELTGRQVWTDLRPLLKDHSHVYAAIAYVPKSAEQVFVPASGSRIIVNGSPNSLKSGLVAPEVLESWIDRGVEVLSLRGLHAKCLLITSRDGTKRAVVGSANASYNSTKLAELALVDDSDSVLVALENQLHAWWAIGEVVDEGWCKRARKIYRKPQREPEPLEDMSVIDASAPLWLGRWMDYDEDLSNAQQVTYTGFLANSPAEYEVFWWAMLPGDEQIVHPGHGVVLFRPQKNGRITSQCRVEPPAKVVAVLPAEGSHPPVAVLVRPAGGKNSTYARLRDALTAVDPHVGIPEDAPLERQDLKDAVFGLWALR